MHVIKKVPTLSELVHVHVALLCAIFKGKIKLLYNLVLHLVVPVGKTNCISS